MTAHGKFHTNPPDLVNKVWVLKEERKNDPLAELRLELQLDSFLAGQRLRLVVYDKELHRATGLGKREVPTTAKGLDWGRFSTSNREVELEFLDPPLTDEPGAPCGILLKRDFHLKIKEGTHARTNKTRSFVVLDQAPLLGGSGLGPFESALPGYQIALKLWGDFDPKGEYFRTNGEPQWVTLGHLAYSREAFESTVKSQPRSLYFRIVLMSATSTGQGRVLPRGTNLICNACPEHISTSPAHARRGLQINDKAHSRERATGGQLSIGAVPSDVTDVTKRVLKQDLTGLWYPDLVVLTHQFPQIYLHINQAGHQRVGWFGPPTSLGYTTGPNGEDRSPPDITGLPTNADGKVHHGAFVTEKLLDDQGTRTRFNYVTSDRADIDPNPFWTPIDFKGSGEIKTTDDPDFIQVSFDDEDVVDFRRLHRSSRRGVRDVKRFNALYGDLMPEGVAAQEQVEVELGVLDLAWDDFVRGFLTRFMREAIDEFWAGKQTLINDHKARMRVGCKGVAKVLYDRVSNLGRLEPEGVQRLHAGALLYVYQARKLKSGGKGPHDPYVWEDDPKGEVDTLLGWWKRMVEFEITDDQKPLDPNISIDARYNARVSEGFKRACITPDGDFEYVLEFIEKGVGLVGLAGGGGFGLHIDKFKHDRKAGTKALKGTTRPKGIGWGGVDIGPLQGSYFSVGAGLGRSPGIKRKDGKGPWEPHVDREVAQPGSPPPGCKLRTACDMAIEDWDGMTFRMMAYTLPALDFLGFKATAGSSALIQFYLPQKPHLHLAAKIEEAHDVATPESIADIAKIPSATLGSVSTTFGRVHLRQIKGEEFEPTEKKPTPERTELRVEIENGYDHGVDFTHNSHVLEPAGIRKLDGLLALHRVLLETPGKLKSTGYASPEGTAEKNLTLSSARALRVRDEILSAVGPAGGKIMPAEKKVELLGLGEEPAKKDKLQPLDDPEGLFKNDPDRDAKRKKFIRDHESDYARWRRVDVWVAGMLTVRLNAKGGAPP